MKDESIILTVKLPLRKPTKRKEKRMKKAVENSHKAAQTASNRIMGIPRKNWGTKRPKNSWWYSWAKEFRDEYDLPTATAHQIIQDVRETYCSWQSNGYSGDRPRFKDWKRVIYRGGRQSKFYRQDEGKWFISLPMASGRGEREVLPIITANYHEKYLKAIENEEAKAADGAELIARNAEWENGKLKITEDTTWWFHQPVKFETSVPEVQELDNIVSVKIARRELLTAGLFDLTKTGEEKYDHIEWVKFLQSGKEIEHYRKQFHHKRKRLMKRGELDKLKKLRDTESRYVDNVLHTVSKRLVDLAKDSPGRTGIVLEDLKYTKQQLMEKEKTYERRALSSWPFASMTEKIDYKATKSGIPVFKVNSAKSSKWCSKCGTKGEKDGVDGWNPDYKCMNCGYEVSPRYVNSIRNVALRFGAGYLEEEIHYEEEKDQKEVPV